MKSSSNAPRSGRIRAACMPLLLSCALVLPACSGKQDRTETAAAAKQESETPPAPPSPEPAALDARAAALDALVRALDDPCPDVREGALAALAASSQKVDGLGPRMLELYRDESIYGPYVVRAAVKTGSVSLDDVKPLLQDSNLELRKRALLTLCELGPEAKSALPLVAAILKDPAAIKKWEAWRPALDTVACMGPDAVPETLLPLSDHTSNESLFREILKVLRDMGPEAEAAFDELMAMYKDKALTQSVYAYMKDFPVTLGNIAPGRKEVMDLLVARLEDPDPEIRVGAAAGLRAMGPAALPALAALLKAMKDKHFYYDSGEPSGKKVFPVRAAAAGAIGAIGPGAAEAVPVLVDNLKKMEGFTAEDMEDALAKIGSAAVPAVAKMLKSKKIGERFAAEDVLQKMGPDAGSALPQVVEALNAGEEGALKILKAMGPEAADALPAVLSWIKKEGCFQDALGVVGAFKAGAKDAVSDLVVFLSSDNEYCRQSAAKALAAVGPGAADAVPKLLELLDDSYAAQDAARALAAIGVADGQVLAALEKTIATSDSSYTRNAAAYALGKLGTGSDEEAGKVLDRVKPGGSECTLFTDYGYLAGRKYRKADSANLVPLLVKMLEDPEPRRWSCAAAALGFMGPEAEGALVPLAAAVPKEGECYLRKYVVDALGFILAPPEEAPAE